MKKEVWKVFSVASFLFVTIFFILPYLVQISTYFHEKGHQKMLTKYGVENSYQLNLKAINPSVEHGTDRAMFPKRSERFIMGN